MLFKFNRRKQLFWKLLNWNMNCSKWFMNEIKSWETFMIFSGFYIKWNKLLSLTKCRLFVNGLESVLWEWIVLSKGLFACCSWCRLWVLHIWNGFMYDDDTFFRKSCNHFLWDFWMIASIPRTFLVFHKYFTRTLLELKVISLRTVWSGCILLAGL